MIPQTIPPLGLCKEHTKMTIIILTLVDLKLRKNNLCECFVFRTKPTYTSSNKVFSIQRGIMSLFQCR